MDDSTFTSDAASMKPRNLLEQLMAIRSLMHKKGAADDDDSRDVIKDLAKKGMTLKKEQLTALSTEFFLTVLLDVMLLRLLDEGEERGATVSPMVSSSDQQHAFGAAAAKKKQKAAAKKKRYKRNKAAAKQKKTKLMSWLSGGIISVIMMVAFSFISTPIVTLSLFQPSDGSGEGKAPPALPPSASKILRQEDLKPNDEASTSPGIISPLAAVVPPPVFAPTALSNHRMRMKSDERRASTCFDTPNWEDKGGDGCDWYRDNDEEGCPAYGNLYEGGMGIAAQHCCFCGGGSHSLPPTNSPKPSNSPTKSANPSSSPSSTPSSSPTKSTNPTQFCLDTPNWKDKYDDGCDWYRDNDEEGCPIHGSLYEGDMGLATKHCCFCDGGSHSLPPTNSPTITNSPSISANPSTAPSTAPSICTDTEGWYDYASNDCVWYEVMDVPGCPEYGDLYKEKYPAKGLANENCCFCKSAIVSTPLPINIPSSSSTSADAIVSTILPTFTYTYAPSSSSTSAACMDTPGWKDKDDRGCNAYYQMFDPGWCCYQGCEAEGEFDADAVEHCCYCKNPSCQDFRSKCQYLTLDRRRRDGGLAPLCKDAESCFCEAAGDHEIEVAEWGAHYTVGLYNECKCDFWSRLCEDTRVGEACDYAAEYCCGDYMYEDDGIEVGYFLYLNSPTCYCDFFNYARNEFGHTLKSKALNISKELDNPCFQLQDDLALNYGADFIREYERPGLEAIYNETNGQKWTNSTGWMNESVDHCEWHGISCDSGGFVTSIDLRGNNLAGQFHYFEHRLSNLMFLKSLVLSDNELTGTIEYALLYNLYSLTHFDVSGNQLSGEVDALVTPSLKYVDFSKNKFTSMPSFKKYKGPPIQTLRFCDVSNNAIKNDATDLFQNIPPNIEQFFASNNEIYGSLPASLNNNLPKLRQFNMSSNALSGSLPDFTESFATLQKLDMSNQSNGFTGSIPDNIWRSLSLKILNLADNKLTGSIPSLVGNLALLEVLELSNNIVKGSIPSELGMLEGTLKRLGLANNTLSETIPSQLGQLQGASVILAGNTFDDSSTAPLSLCSLRNVEEFDLANDTQLCPVERNALSDFYYSTKGAEWTNDTNWLDEYASYCDWKGVSCEKDRFTNLTLANNGLSGRLSKSIGDLAFIEVLDLSDNDIKGSIPTEIGKLSNLTYLRLSYNAFTGTAEVLRELTKLQLLHLQSNRITGMPIMTQLDKSVYDKSAFVTDCGVPSAFDETPQCQNCTICCNANDDCYPTEDTLVAKMGLTYGSFAAVFFVVFIVICCLVALSLYLFGKRKNRGNALSMSEERRLEEDDKYAMRRIGKESVYSYFVTEKPVGWLAAFTTLALQVLILAFFVMASEANLQEDTIDIQFTWKCPHDSDVCKNKADLTKAGWIIFSMLMIAFLAKDMINGCKLIYHSSKVWHTIGSRIRYFIGGMGLCSITLFALYVSTVYNSAIATSNTAIIANSVIVLFIMEIDEYIFSAVDAINDKWTKHAADTKVSDMEKEIARQRAQIESQQGEIESQQEELDNQRKDLGMLREAVEKIQESQAVAVAVAASASDSEIAECEGDTGGQLMEQVDQVSIPSEAEEQDTQELKAAATSSKTISQCTAHDKMTTNAAETGSDADAGKEETTNEMKDENALQADEIVLENGRPKQFEYESNTK